MWQKPNICRFKNIKTNQEARNIKTVNGIIVKIFKNNNIHIKVATEINILCVQSNRDKNDNSFLAERSTNKETRKQPTDITERYKIINVELYTLMKSFNGRKIFTCVHKFGLHYI